MATKKMSESSVKQEVAVLNSSDGKGSRQLDEIWCRRVAITTGPAALTSALHYLDGKRVAPGNQNPDDDITVYQPATGSTLCTMRESGAQDVSAAVAGARAAYKQWSRLSGSERADVLFKAADIIKANLEELAVAEVHDTGKPLWEARVDIAGCADTIRFFAGLGPTLCGQHISLPGGSFGYTRREPLGVVGGIGAWNYPFQMAAFKSAPALICGNTVVFKPSPLTPITTTMMAEVYTAAGLPHGGFNVIQGGAAAGQLLSNHPDIAKMTFTGSVASGSKVMEACAKGIKNVTLELGGKSPVIVFDDCDIDNAVKGTMLANFLNQGQVCSNGTRVYVQRGIYDTFLQRLVQRTNAMRIGDPMDPETTVGAMISPEQFHKVMDYVEGAKQEGVRVLCGGERVTPAPELAGGYYLRPCVLVDVKDDMRVAREEIFGAVACVFPFDTEDEAIQRANDTEYGLAGGGFTRDLSRAHRVAAAIEAGNVYINTYNAYPPELPFGGSKKSGIGRENGLVAIELFSELKTVYVEMNDVDSGPL